MRRCWPRYGLLVCCLLLLSACESADEPVSQTRVANHGLLSAALSPDGEYLFAGSFQHGGALWDQTSNERLYNWNHNSEGFSAYNSADFSEDGKYLAATDGTVLTIWNVKAGHIELFLESPIQSTAIKNSQSIWQTLDGASELYWQQPARILDIAFSKQYVLLGLENQLALLIDSTQSATVGALIHSDVITQVAMNDAATLAVTGTRDGIARLWSLANGETEFEIQFPKPVTFVDISPDGKYFIAAAEGGPVTLANIDTNTQVELFSGNPGVISAAFTMNNLLALGTAREEVWQFDLVSGESTGRWKLPNLGPWHKTAAIALQLDGDQNLIQAVGSNGFTYQLKQQE